MIGRRRKSLMVCQNCHHDIHYGRYDGPSFSKRGRLLSDVKRKLSYVVRRRDVGKGSETIPRWRPSKKFDKVRHSPLYLRHEEQTFAASQGSSLRIGRLHQNDSSVGSGGETANRAHSGQLAAHPHRGNRATAQAGSTNSRAMRALCAGVKRAPRTGWQPCPADGPTSGSSRPAWL